MKHPLFDRDLPVDWEILDVDSLKSPEPASCVAGPFGSNISSKYFVDEGIPVIRGKNLTADRTRFIPQGFAFVTPERALKYKSQHARSGDLVFTCWGTIGQVGLIPDDGPFPEYIISNKQLKLRPDHDRVDSEFLFYYFASPEMIAHIRSRAIGSAVPGINLGILKSLEVAMPPLPTQRKIAAVLAAYDELIENNLRRIEILEAMAQAIYREWFVNFRYPGHEHDPLKASPLGPIPESWEVVQLGDRIELAYGKALKKDNRRGGDVAVFGSSGIVGWHDEALVEGPGIVVGRKGNVGSVHWSTGGFFPIDTTFYVRTELPLRYVFENLHTQHFINSDAAVPGLNRNQAYGNNLLVPSKDRLDRYEATVAPMHKLAETLVSANTNLRATRDLLLPRLISGDLDVSDLEIDTSWLAA